MSVWLRCSLPSSMNVRARGAVSDVMMTSYTRLPVRGPHAGCSLCVDVEVGTGDARARGRGGWREGARWQALVSRGCQCQAQKRGREFD
eukprot:1323726-Rhodomonas_salina.4